MTHRFIQFKKKKNKAFNFVLLFALLAYAFLPVGSEAAFPVISNVQSSGVTTISATITWTTDIASNSFVDYGYTTNYDNTRGNASSYVTDHSVTLDGLDPNTPYKYRVRSADSGGDQTTDDNVGAGFDFSTSATPTISNVRIAEVTNSYVTITWDTDINAYPFIAYGSTDSYGQLIGDEETLGTSHSLTIAGLSAGSVKHYMPRVKDIYGNFTYYGIDSTFTAGAPYLTSFSSSTPSASYGPDSEINITANYTDGNGNNLGASSTATVLLDTGVEVTLDTVGTNTLSGTYTVGSTGSGQNSTDLTVNSIVSQNVCDTNNYCHTGLTMIAPDYNIHWVSDIRIDTIDPIFSSVLPASSSFINNVTGSSDISYTISELMGSGTIVMTRTSGSADPTPHTCTLTGAALGNGAHNNFDTTSGCSEGPVALVDGAVYTFDFNGEDLAGNPAAQIERTGVTFDETAPQLASFTSTTADDAYGPTSNINITATYGVGESLASGSSITVTLNTGVQVVLSTIESGNTLTGIYTVGATGSGQNTTGLTVSTIDGQSAVDQAGNTQSGTGLPATNIADGSDIIIDTTAPNAPSLVQFMTDPVDNSNKNNVTLRVSGEAGATILYSIDDYNNSFTNPVTGSSDIMEMDGSTDIAGIDVHGLDDGTLTATVTLRDPAQNVSPGGEDTVIKDTTGPTFSIQYYSDAGLTNSLGDNPELGAGTFYLKITALESLSAVPTISIAAEGTNNDVSLAATSLVSGNDYIYIRTISADAAAIGSVLENISVTGTDILNNTSTDIDPTNEPSKAAYTDTKKPVISSGSATPDFAKAGTVNVSLIFDDPMDQSTAPTAVISESDTHELSVSGSWTNSTTWTGTATVSSGDANGTATLKVSGAKDLAGNTMDANDNVDTFFIDTATPSFSVNDGVSGVSVTSDTINVDVSDTGGSGLDSQYYGFSEDDVCDAGDTIDNSFSSGIDFDITGDHSEYLCVKASDHADNITYQNLGQLHVDNSAPTVSNVSSNHADGSFKAGAVIDIDVTFSENVISTGDVTVNLDSGGSCTFPMDNSDFGTCEYTVQDGENSADLDVDSVGGTIADQAGNPLTNHIPTANLAEDHAIVIDTTAPAVDIASPLAGTRVKDSAKISFSDDENTDPECSIDGANWVSCESGTTALSDLTGWGSLGEGSFTLYVRDTDAAGNIGTDTEVGVIKDNSASTISNVSSDHSNGSFKAGVTIDIDVTFSEPVTSDLVTINLDSGGSCTFPIDNSDSGTCDYIIGAGESSSDLDANSIEGTIIDQAGNPLTNYIPDFNLAYNKEIVVDTTSPTILSVGSNHADGTFSDPELVDIDMTFSEAVTSDLVTVTLDSGGSCTFSVENSSTGSCDYIVKPGENSPDLNVFSVTGMINDQAGNTMTNLVPATNLAEDHAIVIDTTPEGKPTILDIFSNHADGSFKAGETISVDFIFSEPVNTTEYAAVTFDSGGSCTFTVSSSDTASCSYLVQAGENSADLNVSNVSGTIKDLAQNQMTNFTPASNLAESSDIVIDTTAPLAPSITLVDPITDSNKGEVTITGSGEANASISYSINDTNSETNPVTGTGSVGPSGAIIVNGINLGSLDGGTITASMTLTDLAGNESVPGEDTATSQIVKPTITNVTSDHEDGTFKASEVINIEFTFSENVTSAGDVAVTLNSGGNCTFSVSDSGSASCVYTVQAGENTLDLDVSGVSGTINDQAGNAMINFVPTLNLANNKNIVIDTTAVVLESFSSTTSDNIYGPGSEINITANYSEDVANGSIAIVLNTGAEITLNTIVGDKTITGTYSVGATGSNENTNDLAVSSISSQTVCDINTKCVTDTLLPSTNISAVSNIVIDTDAPEFFDILPANSTNIKNLTTDSGISFTLSEDLNSGNMVITRTAWEEDPDSPHVCILAGDYLKKGEHSKFDTSNCQGGAVELVSGAVYSFSFEGEDLAGNFSEEFTKTGVTFGMDDSAPIISDVSISEITSTGAKITWTTDEPSNTLVDFGTTTSYGKTAGNADDSVTAHEVSISNLTPGTSYKLRIRSADEQDNESIADNGGKGYSLDTLSLAVNSEATVTEITSTGAKISWGSDSVAYSYVYFGTTQDFGRVVGDEESLTKDHVVTLAGLESNTTYYFRARTKDVNGNFSLGSSDSFTTLEETLVEGETGSPKISSVKATAGPNASEVITWKTNRDCNGMVRFGLDNKYGQSAAEDVTINSLDSFATSHEVIINSLLSNTTYHFSVVSYDVSGNIAVSGDSTFKTPSLSSISSVKVTDITLSSATIVWETGDPTTSVVEYGLTTGYGQTKTDAASVNMHKIELTGLETGKTYHFRVKGVSKDSSSVFSDDYVFATNEMPALKGYTLGEVTDSTIALDWGTNVQTDTRLEYLNKNNPDDKGDQGVDESTVDHKLVLTGLEQGTDYELKIKGTDANKNSFESDVILVTTQMDRQAPEISQISTQSSLINGKDNQVQSIITWKTDEAATSQANFDVKKSAEGEQAALQSKEDANLTTNHVVVLSNLKPGIVYYFRVVSKDKNENVAESDEFSMLTPQKQKSVIQMIIANFEQTFGWMNKMKLNK